MRLYWLIVSCGSMLVLGIPSSLRADSPFIIAATNVAISSSGTGVSQYTITGIPVTGTIVLSCGYSGSLMVGNLPICPLTPPAAYPVNAGGTLRGSIYFYPPNTPVPAVVPAAGMALAAVLLMGFRRRTPGGLWSIVFAVGALAGLATLTGCGGTYRITLSPGTYPYTITAVNSPAVGTGPSYQAHTVITVTVP